VLNGSASFPIVACLFGYGLSEFGNAEVNIASEVLLIIFTTSVVPEVIFFSDSESLLKSFSDETFAALKPGVFVL
jgi:hypothetical protein